MYMVSFAKENYRNKKKIQDQNQEKTIKRKMHNKVI